MRLLPFIWQVWLLLVVRAAAEVPTRTIIDVLSSSPEFSVLVELLQHHELVPLINQSWNSTFLAPSNAAFIGVDTDAVTTDQLLYHFINASLESADFSQRPRIVNTYLDDGDAIVMLDLDKGINNGKAEFDEVDMMASPQRGIVHSISALLAIPSTISAQLFLNRDLELFSGLVGPTDFTGCTVFAPTSAALLEWLAADMDLNSTDIAYDYLNSPFGDKDRKALISELTVPRILRPDYLPTEIELYDGTNVTLHTNFSITGPGFTAESRMTLHVARDGLYIEMNDVPAPSALVRMTPEKIILGLGGYRLVRVLDLYGHHKLIDKSSLHANPRIVIVPTGSPAPSSVHAEADLSNLVLYQFIDGSLPRHSSGRLLDTQMSLRSGKYPQRVHFERRPTGSISLNWETLTSDAYRLRNTTFYTTEELLATPPSLTMALGPLLVSSHSLSFLEKLDRLQLPTTKSWTLLVPTRDAWERNILLKNYLDHNEEALGRVFDNLIFSTPIYSDSANTSVEQFSGLKSDVSWNLEERSLFVSNAELNAEIQTEVTDVLFDNGVAHIVTEFAIPQDVEISAADLIKASKRSYFLDLLHAADMSQVLDPHANFTLLVPPSKDFKKHNITADMDPQKLRRVLELHLLPENPLNFLFDGGTAKSLSDYNFEVHETSPSSNVFALAPQGGSGQQVLLTEFGDTNGFVAGGSTVVFIDRHISPQWVLPPKFHLHDRTYTVIGVLIGIVGACVLIFGLAIRVSKPFKVASDSEEQVDSEYHDEPDQHNGEDADVSPTDPIQTPSVNESRAYGRHLDLPT